MTAAAAGAAVPGAEGGKAVPEGAHLGDPLVEFRDLRGQDAIELGQHRAAAAGLSGLEKLADLVERQAEAARVLNEVQLALVFRVVEAVTVLGAVARVDEPDPVVVADGAGGNRGSLCHFVNGLHRVTHARPDT